MPIVRYRCRHAAQAGLPRLARNFMRSSSRTIPGPAYINICVHDIRAAYIYFLELTPHGKTY